jgi:uncharacterized protein YndB with AHSA1/START domain
MTGRPVFADNHRYDDIDNREGPARKEFHGTATTVADAPPQAIFDLITDIDRLPEWNDAIERVVERPAQLEQGTTWTVRMHPKHSPSWGSISRVESLNREQLRFAYETRNTDGNPSYVKWTWQLVERDGASEVAVSWDCSLATLDRRLLAGPIRKRALAREVPRSLERLSAAVRARAS